ncbi:hypothetical protein [Blastococcus sp. Marseille-P5729]|uniref:hypothetical protein n=1 Tax=Blastococcus sp. Marseille-P5729 TaxID=2086582 RepID=UPI000D0F9D41|nr:hypothetical protein [Blastococcus sp. Marseille-P5729]
MPADSVDDDDHAPEAPRKYTYAAGEHRSTPLAIAAGLVALEGLIALGYAVTWGYLSLTGSPTDETASLMGAVFAALGGLLLLRMAVALWQVEVWPRVPVIVLQLIFVPVGWSIAFKLGNTAIGVPMLVLAVSLLALLFSAPVREGYGRDV